MSDNVSLCIKIVLCHSAIFEELLYNYLFISDNTQNVTIEKKGYINGKAFSKINGVSSILIEVYTMIGGEEIYRHNTHGSTLHFEHISL